MTRRSITEEARKRQSEGGADAFVDDGADDALDDESTERRKFTQRMPEALVAEIDEFADAHGMSRNAAINLLSKTGLREL
ncbi:hypothetical protein [Halolamina litorea]|uniref:Ribbon-helix-helix protein, copG family n=1 Tax=Halolamina litorea TaxID=1515593 RepID=A0ABD6BRS4_9EURY|nr:hypothetical protein [Halolamina litorea]